MKVAIPLAKNLLLQLGLNAATSATDAGIPKKVLGSRTTTLVISNDELYDIMETFKSLEDCVVLKKNVTKTVENETKEQRRELFWYGFR